jgi:hypothetical protein
MLISVTVLTLASCTSTAKKTLKNIEKVDVLQKQEKVIETKLSKSTRIYVDGALNALKKNPIEKNTPQTKLAIRLLENAQEIEGVPEHALKLDIDLLTKPIPDKTEEDKLLALEKVHREAISERIKLEEQIKDLQEQIKNDAEKLAIVADKSWFDRLKEKTFQLVSIIAILLCLFFFAPTLFKLFMKLVKKLL